MIKIRELVSTVGSLRYEEVDGVRKEKERLTTDHQSYLHITLLITHFHWFIYHLAAELVMGILRRLYDYLSYLLLSCLSISSIRSLHQFILWLSTYLTTSFWSVTSREEPDHH